MPFDRSIPYVCLCPGALSRVVRVCLPLEKAVSIVAGREREEEARDEEPLMSMTKVALEKGASARAGSVPPR